MIFLRKYELINILFFPRGGVLQITKVLDEEESDFIVINGVVEFNRNEPNFENVTGLLIYHRKYNAKLRIKDN